MEFNDILMLVGAAVCILPVTYMLGYARRESQHGKTVKDCEDNVAFQRRTMEAGRNHVRLLEIALGQAKEALELERNAFNGMKAQWVYADRYRKAIVEALLSHDIWDFDKHEANPSLMLALFSKHVMECAVDPALNPKAKNLHTRGVRKGAAMGRKQMVKLMQKSIDNQAQTINEYSNALQASRTRYGQFVLATRNVLDDKIALPSVRRALRRAISVEVTRIRAVEDNKGA